MTNATDGNRTPTSVWWAAGSSGAPLWGLHRNIRQHSAREEREAGVREEEDNKSQLRLERGSTVANMMINDGRVRLECSIFTLESLREALSLSLMVNCFITGPN